VIQTGRPHRVDLTDDRSQINRDVDAQLHYRTRTLLGVPLRGRRGELFGAFETINKREGNFTDEDPCRLCRDEGRANGVLCVIEGPGDLMALENTGAFRGRYHALLGAISPLDGVGPEDLKIDGLMDRLRTGSITEGSVPQSVSEVLASFHFMPVLAARAVATRSRRSACATGLSSSELNRSEQNSFSIVAAKFSSGLSARRRKPMRA